MSFICSLDEDYLEDLHYFLDDGVMAAFPIGLDTETMHSYFLSVSLQQFLFGDSELSFWIDEYDENDVHAHTHWDPTSLSRVIPRGDRARVRQAVMAAVHILVNAIRPNRVSMSTLGPLPAKAVTKYEEIALIFARSGYTIAKLPPYLGVLTWCMDRVVIQIRPTNSNEDDHEP